MRKPLRSYLGNRLPAADEKVKFGHRSNATNCEWVNSVLRQSQVSSQLERVRTKATRFRRKLVGQFPWPFPCGEITRPRGGSQKKRSFIASSRGETNCGLILCYIHTIFDRLHRSGAPRSSIFGSQRQFTVRTGTDQYARSAGTIFIPLGTVCAAGLKPPNVCIYFKIYLDSLRKSTVHCTQLYEYRSLPYFNVSEFYNMPISKLGSIPVCLVSNNFNIFLTRYVYQHVIAFYHKPNRSHAFTYRLDNIGVP